MMFFFVDFKLILIIRIVITEELFPLSCFSWPIFLFLTTLLGCHQYLLHCQAKIFNFPFHLCIKLSNWNSFVTFCSIVLYLFCFDLVNVTTYSQFYTTQIDTFCRLNGTIHGLYFHVCLPISQKYMFYYFKL